MYYIFNKIYWLNVMFKSNIFITVRQKKTYPWQELKNQVGRYFILDNILYRYVFLIYDDREEAKIVVARDMKFFLQESQTTVRQLMRALI